MTTETKVEINPERLYTAKDVAEYLGIHRDTVYGIPGRHLPRCRIGPKRGRTKFKGRDILAYEERRRLNLIPPADSGAKMELSPEAILHGTPGLVELPLGWTSGVYLLVSNGAIVYVGQSATPIGRIVQHATKKVFDRVFMIPVPVHRLDALEGALIRRLRPLLNRAPWIPGDPLQDEAVLREFCPAAIP